MNNSKSSRRIADIAAATLHEYGIRHAFGMPGGEVLTLVDALRDAGIRFVLCRHETPAATMAAGAGIAGNTPGLLVTTLGPGLANAVNAVADAAQERLPLVIISGVVDHDIRHRYTHQVLDHASLLRGLVKGSFEIEAAGAGATTARAIELALTPPFGPVHLDLAPGTAALLASPADRPARPARTQPITARPQDRPVVELAELLSGAERPLVLAGFEAVRAGAGAAVRKLCERLDAPLITTYKAKGLVDETHPLCLGAAGLSPLADTLLLEVVSKADVILLVDYDPIEMRQGWLEPFHTGQTVVELCGRPFDHAMQRSDRRLLGPTGTTVDALAEALEANSPRWANGEAEIAKEKLEAAFAAPSQWGAHAVVETLQSVLDEDAIVTVDSGAHRILLSQKFRVRKPMGLLQSAGFCSMGIAVPLAAGVKTAAPGRKVVAVVGDGGLEMGLGELATLRDERLNIVIVVIQDESLALIDLKQKRLGLAQYGVGLGKTPFEDIANAYAGYGARVANRADLAAELNDALDRETFSLIVCEIKATDYVDNI